MAIRYVKQRDSYSCGPVAIINILKWLGVEKVTYKLLPFAQIICNCSTDGTHDIDIEKAMKYLEITKKRKISPSIKEVDKHLISGGIILISYVTIFDDGHFSLCVGKHDGKHGPYYRVINSEFGGNDLIYRKDIIKMLHRSKLEKSWTWFIYKE